jgi:hypothetical protein
MSKGMILSCPTAKADRITVLKNNMSEWLNKRSLSDLVKSFGGVVPDDLDLNDLVRFFDDFSNRWDYRSIQKQAFDSKIREGTRWLINNDQLSEFQKECALKAACDLGLMNNNEPAASAYDYIWILGGAKLSCLLRARLAQHIVSDKHLKPKSVVFLASMRPITDTEFEAINTYAPNAKTEFDLCVSSAKQHFCVSDMYSEERYDNDVNTNCSWIIRTYNTSHFEVIVLAAPSSDPNKRRANSVDTYNFFFKNFLASEETSVLLITSQIYVPYQHLEALRTIALPYKIDLDTVGFPSEWGGSLQGMNEPSNYLQEIRSTIQSIKRFLDVY